MLEAKARMLASWSLQQSATHLCRQCDNIQQLTRRRSIAKVLDTIVYLSIGTRIVVKYTKLAPISREWPLATGKRAAL